MASFDTSVSHLVGKRADDYSDFLESYNLKEKKLVPFCTSSGGGISGSTSSESGRKGCENGRRVKYWDMFLEN